MLSRILQVNQRVRTDRMFSRRVLKLTAVNLRTSSSPWESNMSCPSTLSAIRRTKWRRRHTLGEEDFFRSKDPLRSKEELFKHVWHERVFILHLIFFLILTRGLISRVVSPNEHRRAQGASYRRQNVTFFTLYISGGIYALCENRKLTLHSDLFFSCNSSRYYFQI